LPDLPREGRGLGVVSRSGAPAERTREDGASDLGVERGDAEAARLRGAGASSRGPDLGGRGMGRNMGRGGVQGNSFAPAVKGLLTTEHSAIGCNLLARAWLCTCRAPERSDKQLRVRSYAETTF